MIKYEAINEIVKKSFCLYNFLNVLTLNEILN